MTDTVRDLDTPVPGHVIDGRAAHVGATGATGNGGA
jgi:hypothetical protein